MKVEPKVQTSVRNGTGNLLFLRDRELAGNLGPGYGKFREIKERLEEFAKYRASTSLNSLGGPENIKFF